MISSAMYEVLPRGASPRCAPPAKRRSEQPARKAGPRIGGQDRPAPQHRRTRQTRAAAAPARPHAYYISPFTLCQAPFFGFIPRALPDLLRPFMAFPCLLRLPPPAGRRRKGGTLPQGPPRQKSGGSPYGLPPCLVSVVQRGRDSLRPAAARGADSVPKQTRKKPRRRGTGRTVGNARRGNNAAARRSDTVSPPLLPQSAGAQTRRAGAYT